jgi:hypothetical protein
VPVVWREEDVQTKYGKVSSSARRLWWSAESLMDFLQIKTYTRLAASCERTKMLVAWQEEDVQMRYDEMSSRMVESGVLDGFL